MEALVLGNQYETLAILDTFESLIWTDRYIGYGDFEVYFPAQNSAIKEMLVKGNYLSIKGSDRYMIVQDIKIKTDEENGDHITVSGHSLESILSRRIIWGQTVLTGNFQDGIKKLLTENVISPTNTARAIPNFTFKASTDTAITALTVDAQFFGDNLYDSILKLCTARDIGFKVLPSGDGGFEFSLYTGADRSYTQDVLPHIVFSPNFDNLLTSDYSYSDDTFKNAAMAAGEGDGSARKLAEATLGSNVTGLNRYEMFVDASDISQKVETVTLPDDVYLAQLSEKGRQALSDTSVKETFEATVDFKHQYVYGSDFFIGDIVQIQNEYGMESRVRMSELIQSQDNNGEAVTPTFATIT